MPVAAIPASAPRFNTLAGVALRRVPDETYVTDAILVLAASLLVAASARVVIPLPWTPVPITGQTFGVLLVGMLLGWKRGAAALALYLLEGAEGLPFFYGGAGGADHLRGLTAGYLWSYPFAAALMGWLAERGWERRPHGAAAAMALGSLFILAIGSLWLSFYTGGLAAGFAKGMLPFLPGEAFKVAVASALLPGGWALLRHDRRQDSQR